MKVPGLLHIMMCVLDVIFNALLIFPGSEILGFHLRGVWLAMCIELCVRGVLFLIRQAQGKYVNMKMK